MCRIPSEKFTIDGAAQITMANADSDAEKSALEQFFANHPRLMGGAFFVMYLIAITGQAAATGTPSVAGP